MMTRLISAGLVLLLMMACTSTSGLHTGPLGNLDSHGVALQGYDPVSYFAERGVVPLKGESTLTASHEGEIFHFANQVNRDLFLSDPSRYAPRYGGWCAWAMVDGERVDVDPQSFLIEGGALYLFYDGWLADTRKLWLEKGGARLIPLADARWSQLSESDPQ